MPNKFLKWRIGDVVITRIVELESSTIGTYVLPDATPTQLLSIPWITPFIDAESKPTLSFHCLVIEEDDQTIVVDTCIGNDKERSYPRWNKMQSSFLDDFEAAGFDRKTVDTVLCTHMHVDHVGWNTMKTDLGWTATFRNARYLYSRREWEYWKESDQDEFGPVIEDSVQPIFDAGLADLVSSHHKISDAVRLFPTEGHTPGHVSILLSSKGENAIISGDVFHHPCQISHPEWCATADVDQSAALSTRMGLLSRIANAPTLLIGTHFSGPTAGRVVSDGDTYRLDY